MNKSKGKARPKTSKGFKQSLNKLSSTLKSVESQVFSKGPTPNQKRTMTRLRPDIGSIAGSTGNLKLASSNLGTSRKRQVIEEDEYIGEVNGSVAFATTGYPINIGQSSTFPWAYKIASLYERYTFNFLEFYYRREVSEYATNGQTGKVMLSIDYDATDIAPSSKQQVQDTDPHVDGMPCVERLALRASIAEMKTSDGKYVRPGLQPANTDIKTYDVGNLWVSTQGCANATTIGELRVRYRCTLQVPILEPGAGSTGSFGSQMLITSPLLGETSAATTVTGLLFASATNPIVVSNSISATFSSTGLITLPAGSYLIECGNLSSDTAASVTGQDLFIVTSSTLTNYITSTTGLASSGVTTFVDRSVFQSVVFNTTLYASTTIGIAMNNTYASGTCLNQGWLRVTQL
jgi:hypothetical protein